MSTSCAHSGTPTSCLLVSYLVGLFNYLRMKMKDLELGLETKAKDKPSIRKMVVLPCSFWPGCDPFWALQRFLSDGTVRDFSTGHSLSWPRLRGSEDF